MRVIGVMSGTSLDGLDLACVNFSLDNTGKLNWNLEDAITLELPNFLLNPLSKIDSLSPEELIKLDFEFGVFIGKSIKSWKSGDRGKIDLISSHGHTIFHKPALGYTYQIGNGACINLESGIPTVCDFRSGDVSIGGQGAPLVPAGDNFLYPGYSAYLNLGGIANVSFFSAGTLLRAFDICPFNQAINYFANLKGLKMDENGQLGKSGTVIKKLYTKWESLMYYQNSPPKSTGREWIQKNYFIKTTDYKVEDILATFYAHVSGQILKSFGDYYTIGKILVTGGGSKNHFFVEKLIENFGTSLVIPNGNTIDFKEAIIFAYLGWLRVNGEKNILATATGAPYDSIGGCLYGKIDRQ